MKMQTNSIYWNKATHPPTSQTINMPQAQTETETSANFKAAEGDKDQVRCIPTLPSVYFKIGSCVVSCSDVL